MKEFQIAFIPIGVPTFHLESANEQFNLSVTMLNNISDKCVSPQGPLLTIDTLKEYLDTLQPDLIVLQNTTFANSAYANEVIKQFDCDVLLWTLREPVVDGTRLRLNSLTGAYSAGNLMHNLGHEYFEYIYGGPKEDKVINFITSTIKAAKVKFDLGHMTIAAIGQTPQGFGFGRGLDAEVTRVFGANLESIEARELMTKAMSYKPEEYIDLRSVAEEKMVDLSLLPEENIDGFLRLYKAYKDFIDSKNIKAIASRCWPDFFTEYKTPVCAVLGMLNDINIAASCESDLYGALSMFVGIELSNQPTFFGDPVSLDEEKNAITYWHCGTAACSLAREDTGAKMGLHPNRQIGPTMEFGCKPCEAVTIFRIGRQVDGSFRLFIAKGEALDEPQQFYGTSVVVKTEMDAAQVVEYSVKDGWEPHFAIIYGDVAQELEILGRMLDLDVYNY